MPPLLVDPQLGIGTGEPHGNQVSENQVSEPLLYQVTVIAAPVIGVVNGESWFSHFRVMVLYSGPNNHSGHFCRFDFQVSWCYHRFLSNS